MSFNTLNVEFVESLQRAAQRGRPLVSFESISSVTLSGILEYGCLRHAYPGLVPALPNSVCKLGLVRALQEVPSPLGLRSTGPSKSLINNINAQSCEFQLLPSLDTFHSDVGWETFLCRFERSAKTIGFSALTAAKLQSAFSEMSENALLHSESSIPPLVGYSAHDATAQFAVIDVGIGVRASLVRNPRYANLTDDVQAVQLALQTGVSCRRDEQGGFGFHSVFKALAEQWGQLRFRSGNGCISMDGTGLHSDQCRRTYPPQLPGFQVSMTCRVDGSAPSEAAL